MCYHILGEIDGFRVGLIFRHQTNAIDEDIGGLLQHSLHLCGCNDQQDEPKLFGEEKGQSDLKKNSTTPNGNRIATKSVHF